MVNPNVIVATRPMFDGATQNSGAWADAFLRYVKYKKTGFTVIDLLASAAVRTEVERALDEFDPLFFYGSGHGMDDYFTGHNVETIFSVCDCDKLRGRSVYLFSCLTANELGPDIITKGAICYSGWMVMYTWVAPQFPDDDVELHYEKAFGTTTTIVPTLYVNGATWRFCNIAKYQFSKWWVEFWEGSTHGMASEIIKWISHDNIVEPDSMAYGNLDHRRTSEVHHTPVIYVIRNPTQTVDKPFRVAFFAACPQGCDLRGYTMRLVDEFGDLVCEAPLTRFENGVCRSEFVETTYSKIGRWLWKVKFNGDAQHISEEMGGNNSRVLQFLFREQDPQPWTRVFTMADAVGGTTDPAPGTQIIRDGDWAKFTAYPAEGYVFRGWILNGDVEKLWTNNPTGVLMIWHNHVEPVFLPEGVLHKLRIESNPLGIPVTIDGSVLGNTPLEVELIEGEHEISIPEEIET